MVFAKLFSVALGKENTCWSLFLISTMFGNIYVISNSEGDIGKNKLKRVVI
jgi:hypothetical protein